MRQYVVDAFTDKVFRGNPAAVCVLDQWLPDELMMNITKENNLSETAFAVKEGEGYNLRWFTPGGEIDLCGHATLATAYVITHFYETEATEVRFKTLSGLLKVKRKDAFFELDFPAYDLKKVEVTEEMEEAVGVKLLEAYRARDLLVVTEKEEDVRNLQPNMEKILQLDGLMVHITARGKEHDCASRTFSPKLRVPEDPVCGSGHCHIVPYWAKILGKDELVAYQASQRGGILYCRDRGDRVTLGGKAVLYSKADLYL